MSLTAHPFIVAAELSWKQESLGHSNLGGRPRPRRPRGRGWHLPGGLHGTAGRRFPQRPRPA